jgi:hypothetical protein
MNWPNFEILLPRDADPVATIVVGAASLAVGLLLTAFGSLVTFNFIKDFLDGIRAREEAVTPRKKQEEERLSSLGSNEAVWEQTKSSGRSIRDVATLALKAVAILLVTYLAVSFLVGIVLAIAEFVAR